jgi:hypothetical protein
VIQFCLTDGSVRVLRITGDSGWLPNSLKVGNALWIPDQPVPPESAAWWVVQELVTPGKDLTAGNGTVCIRRLLTGSELVREHSRPPDRGDMLKSCSSTRFEADSKDSASRIVRASRFAAMGSCR